MARCSILTLHTSELVSKEPVCFFKDLQNSEVFFDTNQVELACLKAKRILIRQRSKLLFKVFIKLFIK